MRVGVRVGVSVKVRVRVWVGVRATEDSSPLRNIMKTTRLSGERATLRHMSEPKLRGRAHEPSYLHPCGDRREVVGYMYSVAVRSKQLSLLPLQL